MNKRGRKNITSIGMNKRGISPVIATILLVSIVIVIAIIIFIWARGTIKEAVMKNGENAESVCNKVALEASLDGTTLSVTNRGNIAVSSLGLKFISGGTTTSDKLDKINLAPGASGSWEVSGTGSLEIYPVLLGTVGSSDEAKEYICENNKISV